jgi:uncharacterized surface protein with fasciclin (FAS1) repeats
MKKITVALATVAVAAIAFAPAASADCGADHGKKASHADHAHAKKDIVDTAVEAGSFQTLVAAVQAAGLVETLKGEGPYTVFAPTDEAFAKLPEGTVETLLKPENRDQLIAILTYHVVPGEVTAEQVVEMKKAKTVEGQDVTIAVKKDYVLIDNAKILKTDIMASNGVIHVIDTVIMPAEGGKAGSH